MMFCSAKICSIHLLPFLNPACSCLSLLSIAASILIRRTLQKILLGTDRRVITRQLLQLWRSPFLGSLTIRPFVQSDGMLSLVQMVVERSVIIFVAVSMSAFSISAWMESMPQALPFFMALMAVLTSASVGGLILISRTSSAGGALAGSSSSGG